MLNLSAVARGRFLGIVIRFFLPEFLCARALFFLLPGDLLGRVRSLAAGCVSVLGWRYSFFRRFRLVPGQAGIDIAGFLVPMQRQVLRILLAELAFALLKLFFDTGR